MVTSRSVTARVPRWATALIGLACVVIGVVLATRPFTSLSVLVWLVAAAAVLTGLTRWATARQTPGRLDDVTALVWVVLGIVAAAWPDLSVRGIAVVVGAGMVIGGGGDLLGGLRGTQDERLASVLKGTASVVFGVLALGWPDITLLVVAVVFGVRTVLFGVTEVVAAVRGRRAEPGPHEAGRVRRSFHVVVALGALVVALLLGSVSLTLHEAEPTVDAFYDTPSDVPSSPGQLVRSEAFTLNIPEGASAWRILYTTTRLDDEPAVASALVIVPSDATGPLPVIAWAHGTTGIERSCAPSVLPTGLEAGAFFALPEVLGNGWALVATDYIGLGAEGTHPYLVGEPSAHAVLDAVRAARQLEDVSLADETVVWGHSQGGGATLWTGKVAPTYSPDANVLAIAALAPASDLAGLVANLYEIPGGSLFASYLLYGYAATYPDVDVDDYVVATAGPSIERLVGRCLAEPEVLVSVLTSITTGMSAFSQRLDEGTLGDRVAENVPTGEYEMPVFIGQGDADPLVLPDVQAAFAGRLCDEGNVVDYRTYADRDHVQVVEADSPLIPDLIEWTRARFDAQPIEASC